MQSMTNEELWEIYYPKVYGYFFRRVNSVEDVEDLTSAVLTTFLTTIISSSEIKNPHGYLWKVAYHQLVRYIDTKSKRPLTLEVDDNWVAPDNRETESQAIELNRKLESVLNYAKNELNTEDYTIFSRSYIDGDKVMDIAHDLDLKANTVSQKLKRIIAKLKMQIQ
jgi:RNA polymerase sigma factor (sigma-70 family)